MKIAPYYRYPKKPELGVGLVKDYNTDRTYYLILWSNGEVWGISREAIRDLFEGEVSSNNAAAHHAAA